MKVPALTLLVVLAAAVLPQASAQTVYESKGEHGRVFSDRPTTGSRPVELKPLNVVEPVPANAAASASSGVRNTEAASGREERRGDGAPRAADRGAEYRSFAIVFPEPGGTVAANNATFEVRLASDPSLQVAQGHAFTMRLNGRPVPGRFTGKDLMIPPETFDNVAPAGVQRQVLEAFIVDGNGRVIATAAPVDFQTRFVTILQTPNLRPQPYVRPRPLPPQQKPEPTPERPAREPATKATRPTGDR